MQDYSRTIVTYEEIVEAIKAIIDCSLNDNYVDDFDYLNVKYETGIKEKLNTKNEEALHRAIKDLASSIDTASRVIKTNLEKELDELDKSIFHIHTDYLISEELRRIAASDVSVQKLRDVSLGSNILNNPPQYEPQDFSLENVDTNKILSDFERRVVINFPDYFREELAIARGEESDTIDKMDDTSLLLEDEKPKEDNYHVIDAQRVLLIRKAINKAKEKNDWALVTQLEKRLNKELGVEK